MEDAIAELAAGIQDVNYRVASEGYGVVLEVSEALWLWLLLFKALM
jgi:hypothetical protein